MSSPIRISLAYIGVCGTSNKSATHRHALVSSADRPRAAITPSGRTSTKAVRAQPDRFAHLP